MIDIETAKKYIYSQGLTERVEDIACYIPGIVLAKVDGYMGIPIYTHPKCPPDQVFIMSEREVEELWVISEDDK